MDNLLLLRKCQKALYEIEKCEIEKAELEEQRKRLSKEAKDKTEKIGCLGITVTLIVGILLKANGVGWIETILGACVFGGIVDLPFEWFRKRKYTKEYSYKEHEIENKLYLINNRISDFQNDDSYIMVESIVNNDMNNECLTNLVQQLTKDSNMSLETAYYNYICEKK